MISISHARAIGAAESMLKEWLGEEARVERSKARADHGADFIARLGRTTLVVEVKTMSDSASLAKTLDQVRRYARAWGNEGVATIAVPFMGEAGQRLCERAGVSWFDLSGNARIAAPGLRIHVEGKPNKFKRPGRPSTVFAARSSRIARELLIASNRSFHQRELSRITGLNEGFTSRVVHKLEADGLVARDRSGAVRPKDPDLLLDAWAGEYDFTKHRILRGHITTRSAEEAQRRVVDVLEGARLRCSATGLGAAWLLSKFAGFRLVTVYVSQEPEALLLDRMGFREEERGANTWLVIPNDEGVFAGRAEHEKVSCVHPVQVYLDLKAHPERAREAATELRKQLLTWA